VYISSSQGSLTTFLPV